MNVMRAQEGPHLPVPEGDLWGDSDEEPDGPILLLMRRTATHVLTSPNPAQLESRILANHGSDRRFAFLRGRWRKAWTRVKFAAKNEEALPRPTAPTGLVAYGSDEESEEDDVEADNSSQRGAVKPAAPMFPASGDDPKSADDLASIQEARRIRARTWALERRSRLLVKE